MSGKRISAFRYFLFAFLGMILILPARGQKFYPKLQEYCIFLTQEFDKIPDSRKESLNELAKYITHRMSNKEQIQLLFICPDNSRRSQFAEIWAQTAAYYYGLKNISTYSGGLNQSAINFHLMESLKRAGFSVTASEIYSENPVYLVSPGKRFKDIFVFSKRYDYWNNPNDKFATVLCSKEVDMKNINLPGSEKTILLPYRTIKIFDNSPGGILRNDEICREIAREMFFVMEVVKKNKKKKKNVS